MKYEIEEKHVAGPWLAKAAADEERIARAICDLLRLDNMHGMYRVVFCKVVIAPQSQRGWREERIILE